MRFRILGLAVIVGAAGVATTPVRGAARMDTCCVESHECCDGGHACCQKASTENLTADKQWSIVTFKQTVRVAGRFVSGPVLIVHDDQKMARGEPCTTFYRFDPAKGPKDELVSFHCIPRRAPQVTAETTFKTVVVEPGMPRLLEYQIAGDDEIHGVPR